MPYEITRGDITIRVTTEREFQVAIATLATMFSTPALPSTTSNGILDPAAADLLADETPTEPLEDRFFQTASNE